MRSTRPAPRSRWRTTRTTRWALLSLAALTLALAGVFWAQRASTGAAQRLRPPRATREISRHVELGIPVSTRPDHEAGQGHDAVMAKKQFVFSYDPARRVPRWVSWNLNASDFGRAARHRGRFLTDESLPASWPRATHADYTSSAYDRGHLVRSEERTATAEDNLATFFLTNVVPQTHDLNAGPWLRLEEELQRLAQRDGRDLYIVAGGIFGAEPETLGGGVAVPEACYKIVVVMGPGQRLHEVTSETPTLSVLVPNVTGIRGHAWSRYLATMAEVEAKAGLRFFSAVPPATHDALRAQRHAPSPRPHPKLPPK